MSISIALVIALALLIVSIIFAVINQERSPLYFAVLAGVIYLLFAGFAGFGGVVVG